MDSRIDARALLVAGAFFMENFDSTVIVTALPQMAASLDVPVVDLNVGLSAYMLTLAVLIPISGWTADRFGARRVFSCGIIVFTVASMFCGLSQSVASFTAARILQGAGGAIMVPVGRLLVLRTTSKPDLMRAIATITWPGLVAPVLGPPVGGFISTYMSWRWIFFVNLPLGLIALVFALTLLRKGPEESDKPFDAIGFVLTSLACFGLMYGLELIGHDVNSRVLAAVCLIASLVLGWLAARHARRHRTPLVELDALRFRTFAVAIYSGSLIRIALSAVPFLLPLLFQIGFGFDAFSAGLLVLAVFAGNLTMKPLTTPVLRRWSFRQVLLVNGFIGAFSILCCGLLTATTPMSLILLLLFAGGLSRSMQFTALSTIAFAEVPAERMSGANTLFNMAQQMSTGLGVSLAAVALRLPSLFQGGSPVISGIADFRLAFLLMGLLALAAVAWSLSLSPDAGANLQGKEKGTVKLKQFAIATEARDE
jgi:EmrB/QacA subfamily drug resistance transporter